MRIRIEFEVDPELSDALSGCLFEAGVEGLEEQGLSLVTYVASEQVEGLVAAYDEFRSRARLVFPMASLLDPIVSRVEGDASARWLEFVEPIWLTQRWVLSPHGYSEPLGPIEQTLWYVPSITFGDGGHATTRLCAEYLDAFISERTAEGSSVEHLLDVGTGSGVLSVLGLRAGAERAVATDIDPRSVDAARENARLNGVSERLEVLFGEALPVGPFDCIVANIDVPTLLSLAPALRERLVQGGHLVLSGLLVENLDEVHAAYVALELALVGRAERGDWALLAYSPR